MAEYKLELKGICKSFPGVKALDNVQLSLRPGTVHALMGENGAGKSTLMKCLFGIYKMDAGEVYLDGQKIEVNNPDEAMKYGIAMVHQELQPVPARSVAENLYLGRFPTKNYGLLIRNNRIFGLVKGFYTSDTDHICTRSLDTCSHTVQEVRNVYNMRLSRCILDRSTARCHRSCHHNVNCCTNRNHIKENVAAMKILSLGNNCAMTDINLRTKSTESLQMLVNWTASDIASSWECNMSLIVLTK